MCTQKITQNMTFFIIVRNLLLHRGSSTELLVGTPLWIRKKICGFAKIATLPTNFIPKIVGRAIIVRDANCFHHFEDGVCSLHGLLVMPVVQLLDILCSLFNSMWDIWRKILHHNPPQIFCKICFTSHTYTQSNLAPFMTSIQVSKWKRKKERLPDGSTFNPCPSQTLKISISPLL